MSDMEWYKFTEVNDNEGEEWNFYLLLNQEEVDHLQTLTDDYFYTLDVEPIPESEVDILVKHSSDDGYMPEHQKVGRPRINILDIDPESLEENDVLYKGGLA